MAAIVFSTDGEAHRIDTELTQQELAAIGYVTVLWAELEHQLLARSVELSGPGEPPADVVSLSFKKRLRAWRALIKSNVPEEPKRLQLLSLATRIGSIERSRNRITHGLWGWEPRRADMLRATSFREPFHFDEPFDFAKLIKIAHRIGEATFQLRFPDGEDEAWLWVFNDRLRRGLPVNRQLALETIGRDPANPHLPPASRKAHNTPQSPLRAQLPGGDPPPPPPATPKALRSQPKQRRVRKP